MYISGETETETEIDRLIDRYAIQRVAALCALPSVPYLPAGGEGVNKIVIQEKVGGGGSGEKEGERVSFYVYIHMYTYTYMYVCMYVYR
jgi:hypothetical protein